MELEDFEVQEIFENGPKTAKLPGLAKKFGNLFDPNQGGKTRRHPKKFMNKIEVIKEVNYAGYYFQTKLEGRAPTPVYDEESKLMKFTW